jgi:D-alanyl-D-alanine carboxypeptidase
MNPSFLWTSAAMISTLEDLHTWAQALATGALLRPAQQRQRLTWNPYSAAATHGLERYGLAVINAGGPGGLIGHPGSIVGFNTDMWYLPAAHATVVVIANSCDGGVRVHPADDLVQQIAKIVFLAPSAH